MTVNNSFFFILKVLVISALISIIIKYVPSNFNLISQTHLALPIVFTPTIIVLIILSYRSLSAKDMSK
ncbi:hypothetical protein Cyast_1738 [Cyanobacterium stanieri PCC 7202]|uniref:Uncharacterized protein n=1 Tax=Cyanobacterium stanieri (strain ATCC 29140 / PCC 7202) TaxID=292563 RepID=K9YLG2_CYASC|nr:hypothetical protein Cyast_1738 [Cyanobacterium stanieri PCC 7202]